MKVLVVTHKPPFPKIDGGCLASAQLILGLEKSGIDFRIALIETPKHPFKMESFPATIRDKIPVHHFVDTGAVFRNLKHWINKKASMFTLRFYDREFSAKLKSLCLDFQPDIIHFESLFAAVYLDDLQQICKAKMILRSHNMEHQLWQDRMVNANSIKKWMLKQHVARLKMEEIQTLRKVDGLVAIAKNELDFLREYNLHQPAVYIPTGFDLGTRESGYGNDFFHLAAMDWQPNILGLTWFLKEVWQHSPCAKNNLLHLAGKGLDKQQYNNYDGLKNHGEISDSQAFMCDYGIMLVPLFEGSGLRIKIIEAGALGVPIIATTKAVEGIGLLPNVHFLEANTSNEFEKAMQLLVNDVSLRQSLGAAIRVFMQQNYNQDIFNDRLIEFYQNI